jgi:hypothetical protein
MIADENEVEYEKARRKEMMMEVVSASETSVIFRDYTPQHLNNIKENRKKTEERKGN